MKIIHLENRAALPAALQKPDPELQLRAVRVAAPGTVNESERTVVFVLSDETQDHAGDVIRQAGWDLSIFSKNPVLPWCHDYDEPPIGGWQDVRIEGSRLLGLAKFATPDDYPFADTIFRLVARGFLRAVSVGFNPKRYNEVRDSQQGFVGYEFLEQTLLECSACTVPCNPNALARSIKENVISRRELAEIVTRKILSEMDLPQPDREGAKIELISRIEFIETEIETLKSFMSEHADADGKPATSPAAASAEVARVLDLIEEIKTLGHGVAANQKITC